MYDVITIGTATEDVFLTSPLFKVLRDPEHLKKIGFPAGEAQCFALGGKMEVARPVFATGGGATNAAVTFARQGLKTAALIKIGEDEAGEKIVRELRKEKVQTIPVRDKKENTAYSTVLLAPNGERTILVYRGASEDLKKNEIPLSEIDADWVYIVPGGIDFGIINELVDFFFEKGVNIAFSPSRKYTGREISGLSNILGKSRAVILNREEASYLTGIDYADEKAIFRALDKAVPGIVAMTDGASGALISDGFRIYEAGIFEGVKVIDRTGAGDAFASGFVAGLIQKNEKCDKTTCRSENIEYAIRLGSANAASVIEKIGAKAGILTRSDFEKSKRWQELPIRVIGL